MVFSKIIESLLMISIAQSLICISFMPIKASTPVLMIIEEHLQTIKTL
jgi:hypothetical protein